MANYATKKDGTKRTTKKRPKPPKLNGRYKALQEGTLSVEDLTDEEIFRGKLMNDNGTFKGRYPDAIPRKFYDAAVQELHRRWQAKVNAQLDPMLKVLKDLALNPKASHDAKYKSAVYLIERAAGKVPEKNEVKLEVSKWEDAIEGILVDTDKEEAS